MNPARTTHVAHGKAELKQLYDAVKQDFANNESGQHLMQLMCAGVDRMLINIWQEVAPETSQHIDFIAVGGYGRGELAPQSDWDVWFLVPEVISEAIHTDIQSFLYVLWDMNANIGHAVRSNKETLSHITEDWNSATAAQEMRLLHGQGKIFAALKEKTAVFFRKQRKLFVKAKLKEHQARHQRTGDSAFMMEPNIKECKGGLRDVQSVFWIAKAWFNIDNLDDLVKYKHISYREMQDLLSAQDFLWRCRVGLHLQSKRPNDRLSFEQQVSLAEVMGYQSKEHRPAVDGLMKDYFRHAGRITRVSGLILQDIRESMDLAFFQRTKNIDADFNLTGIKVGIRHDRVFQDNPLNLLRIFYIGQQDHRRLSCSALRQMRADAPQLIDDNYRAMPECHRHFLRIIRFPRNVAWALKEMNDTGILGLIIPAFRNIVGLGQFNLYHAYTVDEHTIRAVGEARNMKHQERKLRLPLTQEVITRLKRPELLYLALIFHDIAKGMAGDHSENGAVLAHAFCLEIGLVEDAASFVSWLVREHLTMAVISQRFDLSDPEVIKNFADQVGSMEHLNCLLCLTVADIAAVGPNVWNDWKGSLLSQLYHATRHALMGEGMNPDVLEKQQKTRISSTLSIAQNPTSIAPILKILPKLCISHFPPYQLLPISKLLADSGVLTGQTEYAVGHFIDHERCDTMIMVASHERPYLFTQLTAAIATSQVNIIAAHAFALKEKKVLDIFYVQDQQCTALTHTSDITRLTNRISHTLAQHSPLTGPKIANVRKTVLMERVPVRVRNLSLSSSKVTAVEVAAADRTGLLARFTYAISLAGFDIQGASISSFGERVVDVFFIQYQGKPLTDEQMHTLSEKLTQVATLRNDG